MPLRFAANLGTRFSSFPWYSIGEVWRLGDQSVHHLLTILLSTSKTPPPWSRAAPRPCKPRAPSMVPAHAAGSEHPSPASTVPVPPSLIPASPHGIALSDDAASGSSTPVSEWTGDASSMMIAQPMLDESRMVTHRCCALALCPPAPACSCSPSSYAMRALRSGEREPTWCSSAAPEWPRTRPCCSTESTISSLPRQRLGARSQSGLDPAI